MHINKLLQPKNNLGRGDPNCLGRGDPNCLGHGNPKFLGRGDPNCLGRGDPNFLTQKIWFGRVCTQNFWVVFDYIFLGRPDPKIFTVLLHHFNVFGCTSTSIVIFLCFCCYLSFAGIFFSSFCNCKGSTAEKKFSVCCSANCKIIICHQ